MPGFSTLEIGKRGLIAQRFGLDTTSNNIANVNTPGYSRRTATLSETRPLFRNGKFEGTGAIADSLRTFRAEYIDREIRATKSRNGGYEADEKLLTKIEAILAEPSDLGLNEIISQFYRTFDEISLKPENIGLREYILGQAQTLVERFHITAEQLKDTRRDTMNLMEQTVEEANGLLKDIAELNVNVSNTHSMTTHEAQTYVDQRELKLEELSKMLNVTITYEENGTANVFTNGINLVTEGYSGDLKLTDFTDSSTGELTARLNLYNEQTGAMTRLEPQTGELASYLKHYNETLDEFDSSGNFSVATSLNEYVETFANRINELTMSGYGLHDATSPPVGRAMFDPQVGQITASNIEVSSDVAGKPEDIPLSSKPGEPGNSEISRNIARIAEDKNFLNNQTPTEYYAGFLGKIGSIASESANGKKTTRLVGDQLESQRESIIGVNLDEEATNLIKFQKAFEASSRVINTTNELLSVIVNLGR